MKIKDIHFDVAESYLSINILCLLEFIKAFPASFCVIQLSVI